MWTLQKVVMTHGMVKNVVDSTAMLVDLECCRNKNVWPFRGVMPNKLIVDLI